MWARELPAHGCAVSEPRSRRAHPKHRECAQGTSAGWAFFGLPFFAHQRKVTWDARRAVRNALKLALLKGS